MQEPTVHPLDYMSVLRRRKWWLIVPLTLAVISGALLASFLPREYLSQATIGVVAPTLSPELLRGVGSFDKDERQRAISQQLLSPAVLQRVVREEHLSPGQPTEQIAFRLRQNVEQNISVPAPIAKGGEANAIVLGYTDSDPGRAQRIANRLAAVFVDENSKRRIERSENTAEILTEQLQASQQRLGAIEIRLRDKKQTYMGRLPNQVDSNVQMVNGLRNQLDSISTQLRSEQDRLSVVESQIGQLSQGSGTDVVSTATAAAIQGAQRRVADLQQQLVQARAAGWTDKHPEVLRLQEELKQARTDLTSAQQTTGSREDGLRADPIYLQKLRERDNTRLRIRDLQRTSALVQSQIGSYQSRVDTAPMVEQEFASIQREYEMEKLHYADLNTKHQQASMAEDVTRKQGGEQFSVLVPATMPAHPQKPDRMMIMLLSVAAGLVLGAGAALGREFLDRSVHDARALQREFGVPVLAEIPRISA